MIFLIIANGEGLFCSRANSPSWGRFASIDVSIFFLHNRHCSVWRFTQNFPERLHEINFLLSKSDSQQKVFNESHHHHLGREEQHMGKHSPSIAGRGEMKKTEVRENQICNFSSAFFCTHMNVFSGQIIFLFIFNYLSDVSLRTLTDFTSEISFVTTLAVKLSHKSDNESVIATKRKRWFYHD